MTTMTRQHFALIAGTLKDELQHVACGEDQRAMVRSVAHAFVRTLHRTNPNFNRARFLRACGVEE